MRVGVFVGSFDPIHRGHEAIMNDLVKEKIVDKVLVIPTGNYWDKQNLSELGQRIEMLKLIATNEIMVDDGHNYLEYTYQILDKLEEENRENEYYLIMGWDNYEKIHLWKNYQEIMKRKIIVINRDELGKVINNKQVIYINKNFQVSSSKIREKIKEGKYEDISSFLDRNVLEYIMKKGLYR